MITVDFQKNVVKGVVQIFATSTNSLKTSILTASQKKLVHVFASPLNSKTQISQIILLSNITMTFLFFLTLTFLIWHFLYL